jgi:hypothetical protein
MLTYGAGQFINLMDSSSLSNVKSWIATSSTNKVKVLAYDPFLNVMASGDDANLVKVWDMNLWANKSSGKTEPVFYFHFSTG